MNAICVPWRRLGILSENLLDIATGCPYNHGLAMIYNVIAIYKSRVVFDALHFQVWTMLEACVGGC